MLEEGGHDIDGIILLGGAVGVKSVDGRIERTLHDSIERVRYAAVLARQFPEATIYVSGGQVFTRRGAVSEAQMTASLLGEFGIHPMRLRLEPSSRNTVENAQMIGSIVAQERPAHGACYLLVTSAFHMPRAMVAFQSAGVPVLAAPTDWQTDEAQPFLQTSLIGNLGALDLAAHEYLGLLALSVSAPRPAGPAPACPGTRGAGI
jgi:uncharacterized SAM-binding protein YcdF (DUF218 family)